MVPAAAVMVAFGILGASAAAPPTVTVAEVTLENVAPAHSFIGHVMAIQSVQVVARVTAFIDDVPVKQGSDVKAGEVLFELQKAQYQDAVASAQAQLASAQAALRLAQVTVERAQRLAKQQFETQANLDQALATRDQDQANVQAAQANLAQAQLNLSYCTISSPIAGRIGAVTLTKGNLVTPSTPTLAAVVQINPIRVVFAVSDRIVVSAEQRAGTSASKLAAGVVVNLKLPDGSSYPQEGRIAFLNNEVDQQTGTINVYADFPNPEGLLLPGSFVNVETRRAQPEEQVMIPVQAVQTEQTGSYVLVVGPDNKVRQQPVELGRQIAQSYIVKKGVSAGERVIVQGVQKVRPGEIVNPLPAPAAPGAAAGAQAGARE